jgi:hypothetical protein
MQKRVDRIIEPLNSIVKFKSLMTVGSFWQHGISGCSYDWRKLYLEAMVSVLGHTQHALIFRKIQL